MFYLTFYNQLYFISRISILEQLYIPFWYQAVFNIQVGPYPHLFMGRVYFYYDAEWKFLEESVLNKYNDT